MDVGISEDLTLKNDKALMDLLLIDRSTKHYIVWATDDYVELGKMYAPECEITPNHITGFLIIRPRIAKAKEKQNSRTRNKAEVFTPSWVCNEQNNLVDEQWFGKPNVFNIMGSKKWEAVKEKVVFPASKSKTWQNYVRAKRMEITCGEAPYLASRYDTVSGEMISDVHSRIGLLDRKLRIVNENTDNKKDWFLWVKKAYQSIYGYEFCGDSLFIARKNLLYTFADNMLFKFNTMPNISEMRQIAYIISWNIWQMDGLTFMPPFSKEYQENNVPLSLFDYCENGSYIPKSKEIPCVIRDWTNKCYVEFRSLIKKGGE